MPGKMRAQVRISGSVGALTIGRERAVVRVDDELDAVPHVAGAVAQPLGVRIAVGRGVGVEDPLERAVGRDHEIGIAIEPEERQRPLRPLPDVPVVEHPAVVGDVLREQDLRGAESGGEQQAAEEIADPDAARAGVGGVDVGLACGMVELPLPGAHEHVLVGELAVVDLRPGDLERHGRDRRQVLDEQHRQAFAGDLVDRAEREPHPVGERQVLVDEGPGRERRGVELPRREQDLPVLPVDPVPVVVHGDEIVVGADLLQLPEGQQQRVPVPEPHVLDGRRVGPDVGQREIGLAVQLAGLHAVEPPRLPGGDDVIPEVGRLAGQLGRRHDEASASPAGRGRGRRRPRPRSRRSPGARSSASCRRAAPISTATATSTASTAVTRSAGSRACRSV